MAIVWAGTSIADLEINNASLSSGVGTTVSPNVNEGFETGSDNNFSPVWDQLLSEFWYSQYFRIWSSAGAVNHFGLCGPARQNMIRCTTGSSTRLFQNWNGTAWVDIGLASIAFGGSARVWRVDMNVKFHPTDGVLKVYADGTLALDYAGPLLDQGLGGCQCLQFGRGGSFGEAAMHSAMMVSTEDTRALTFYQRLPNGTGTLTDWTGDYTAVDETGINDTDMISTSQTGHNETFTMATFAPVDGQSIEAVRLTARARGPGNTVVRGLARVSGQNHAVISNNPVKPSFGPASFAFNVNPVTGQPWTVAEVNAAQFGVRSA